MFLTGALGIMLRFAYMKRKEETISNVRLWSYFFISFGILILIIIFLKDRNSIFGYVLDDGTKMIMSAIASLFTERFFILLMDKDTAIFNKLFKKYIYDGDK